MSYVCLMIMGHGLHPTRESSNESVLPELIRYKSDALISTVNFSPAGESCFFVPDYLHPLKINLTKKLLRIQHINIDSFKKAIFEAEMEVRGMKYTEDWAHDFHSSPQFAGRQVESYSYYEKQFTGGNSGDCGDGKYCGVYIINSNTEKWRYGGEIIFDRLQPTLLSDIIANFQDVDNIYILDATCSVVSNPGMTDYITNDARTRRLYARKMNIQQLGGKRRKSKKNKKKRKIRKTKKLIYIKKK